MKINLFSTAKVQHFFDMTKYFHKKMQKFFISMVYRQENQKYLFI